MDALFHLLVGRGWGHVVGQGVTQLHWAAAFIPGHSQGTGTRKQRLKAQGEGLLGVRTAASWASVGCSWRGWWQHDPSHLYWEVVM